MSLISETMNLRKLNLQKVFPFLTEDEFLFLKSFLLFLLTNVFKDETMRLSTFSTEGLNASFLCMLFNLLNDDEMIHVTMRLQAIQQLKNLGEPEDIVDRLFSEKFTKDELYDIVKQMMGLFNSKMAVSYFEDVRLLNTVKTCLSIHFKNYINENTNDDYVPSNDETEDDDDDYIPSEDEDDEENEDTQDTEDEEEETEDEDDEENEHDETEDTEDTKNTKVTKVTEDTVSVKNLTHKVNGLCFIMAFAIVWNTCGFTTQNILSALAHLGFIMLGLMEMGFMMVQNAIIFIWWHILRFDLDTILMSLA